MDISTFKESLEKNDPPASLGPVAEALWWDSKGNWQKAHKIAQDIPTPAGSRVHAYLHRKEGDLSNADYWYGRAGTYVFQGYLKEEWEELVRNNID